MADYVVCWSGKGALPGAQDWPPQRESYASLIGRQMPGGRLPTVKEASPGQRHYTPKPPKPVKAGGACKGCGVDIGRAAANEGYIRCPACRKARRWRPTPTP